MKEIIDHNDLYPHENYYKITDFRDTNYHLIHSDQPNSIKIGGNKFLRRVGRHHIVPPIPDQNVTIDELYIMIDEFMKVPEILSGHAFKNEFNTPSGWYEAISTTGFCVVVSEKFKEIVLDNFGIESELISICIDSNKYGKCFNGTKNGYHTAIRILDGKGLTDRVVDIRCAQFGSKYINHFVWYLEEWLNEFQSTEDRHSKNFR